MSNVKQPTKSVVSKKSTPNKKKSNQSQNSNSDLLENEFGGTIGAYLIAIFLPLFTMYMLISWNPSPKIWFTLNAFLLYSGYLVILALLSILPFGGSKIITFKTKTDQFTYYTNGIFSLTIFIAILTILEVNGIPAVKYLTDNIFAIAISSIIVGVLLSIYLYLRSFYVPQVALNRHTVGKSGFYYFIIGREIKPRIFGLFDLKLLILRYYSIISLVLEFAFVYNSVFADKISKNNYKNFDFNSLNIKAPLILYFILKSVYTLDPLLFEDGWVTTFEYQREGLGYMLAMGYAVYPFMTIYNIAYLADYNTEIPLWRLAIVTIINIIGYSFFRGSNDQKDAFKKNPKSPRFANVETIQTAHGNKLLCSGFWGLVRHPNYLGDILIQLSFIMLVFTVPSALLGGLPILLLIDRTRRDQVRCKQKYGTDWDKYCRKVRYVLVPKIY